MSFVEYLWVTTRENQILVRDPTSPCSTTRLRPLPSEKLENYFFKTLLNRNPRLRSSRRMTKGKREHCLVGVGLKPCEVNADSGLSDAQKVALVEKIMAKKEAVAQQ